MIARDTTPDAAAVQETAYRNAGPAGRLRIAMELSDLVRALAAAGVRKQHPEYTEAEVTEALIWQIYKIRRPKPESE